MGRKPGADRLAHALHGLFGLDALVDALLDEDAVERARVEKVVELAEPDLLLALRELHEPLDVGAEDLRHLHQPRAAVDEHHRARRDRLLAAGEGVERGHRLLRRRPGGELQLDADRLAGEVVDLADGDLLLLDGVLDRLRDGVGGLAPGQLGDDEFALLRGVDARAHLHLAEAVLVVARVHDSAELEVRQKLERLLLDDGDLRLEELDEVVGQDGGGEADGDSVRAQHQQQRQLRGQVDRLLVAPVVAVHVGRGLGIEDVVAGERGEAALDVARRRVRHAGVERAVVALSVDEIAAALAPELVRQASPCGWYCMAWPTMLATLV